MKLFVTILVFCCSLLIQERGLARVRGSRQFTSCMVHRATNRSITLTAPQSNFVFDELSWCDDDDNDDESTSVKKKIQALHTFQKINDLIIIKGQFTCAVNRSLLNGNHSRPGADKCIFQRVIRV